MRPVLAPCPSCGACRASQMLHPPGPLEAEAEAEAWRWHVHARCLATAPRPTKHPLPRLRLPDRRRHHAHHALPRPAQQAPHANQDSALSLEVQARRPHALKWRHLHTRRLPSRAAHAGCHRLAPKPHLLPPFSHPCPTSPVPVLPPLQRHLSASAAPGSRPVDILPMCTSLSVWPGVCTCAHTQKKKRTHTQVAGAS